MDGIERWEVARIGLRTGALLGLALGAIAGALIVMALL